MYTVRDEPSLYPDSLGILQACRDHKLPMAIASRTPTPRVAQAFMHKLGGCYSLHVLPLHGPLHA